jgi:T5SS/PEP-CTERM-associated repeat protein
VGSDSSLNELTVNSGAVVFAGSLGVIGRASGASMNTVTVTDPGSMWVNGGDLYVGRDGPSNQLFVSNGGTVSATNLFVGVQPTSTANRVVVDGGTLRVTNAAGTSVLDVRRGTNVLNSGLIDVDQLVMTNQEVVLVSNIALLGNSASNHIGTGVGTAHTYPSTILVEDLAGFITNVTVTLSNLTYPIADDLDILLARGSSPKVMLMSTRAEPMPSTMSR